MNYGLFGLQNQSPRSNIAKTPNVSMFTPDASVIRGSNYDDEFSIDKYLDPKWGIEASSFDIIYPTVENSLLRAGSSNAFFVWQTFDNPSSWTMETKFHFSGNPTIVNYAYFGLSICQDTGTRLIFHPTLRSTNYFQIELSRWTSLGGWAQTYSYINFGLSLPAYWRMGKYTDNAIYCSVSWDGLFFFRVFSQTLNSIITPNRIGLWGAGAMSAGVEYFRYHPAWIDERNPLNNGGAAIRG